jgi:flagellar biosynthesis/type III secretory pathway M-ring protein FliF/YscJ
MNPNPFPAIWLPNPFPGVWLSDEQIVLLTGEVRVADQIKVLDKMRVHYTVKRDGRLVVVVRAVIHALRERFEKGRA